MVHRRPNRHRQRVARQHQRRPPVRRPTGRPLPRRRGGAQQQLPRQCPQRSSGGGDRRDHDGQCPRLCAGQDRIQQPHHRRRAAYLYHHPHQRRPPDDHPALHHRGDPARPHRLRRLRPARAGCRRYPHLDAHRSAGPRPGRAGHLRRHRHRTADRRHAHRQRRLPRLFRRGDHSGLWHLRHRHRPLLADPLHHQDGRLLRSRAGRRTAHLHPHRHQRGERHRPGPGRRRHRHPAGIRAVRQLQSWVHAWPDRHLDAGDAGRGRIPLANPRWAGLQPPPQRDDARQHHRRLRDECSGLRGDIRDDDGQLRPCLHRHQDRLPQRGGRRDGGHLHDHRHQHRQRDGRQRHGH